MRSSRLGARPGLAVAVTLLLALGAACNSDTSIEPSAAPPSTLSPSSGPATAAAGPTDTPTNTQPPPATTPVPPPTPGGVDSTVEAKPEESKKPVKLDMPSTTGTGLSAKVVSIKAMEAKAQIPGEIQGPALAVTVEVRNKRDKATDLSAVVVTLLDSEEAPGSEMSTEPAKPLAGKLAAGKTARGTYVFTVAKNKRKPITVSVSISDDPVLVFIGNAR